MAVTIESVWTRLQNIYNEHAPGLTFNPPATENEIEQLESKLNVTLPADFKDSLRLHNGVNVFPTGELLTTARIYEEWKMWSNLLDEGVFDDKEDENIDSDWDEEVRSYWWTRKWIPIVADGCGNGESLDFDPGETGVVGQVIYMCHDDGSRPLRGNSFTHWLDDIATKVQNGDYVFTDGYFVDKDDA